MAIPWDTTWRYVIFVASVFLVGELLTNSRYHVTAVSVLKCGVMLNYLVLCSRLPIRPCRLACLHILISKINSLGISVLLPSPWQRSEGGGSSCPPSGTKEQGAHLNLDIT